MDYRSIEDLDRQDYRSVEDLDSQESPTRSPQKRVNIVDSSQKNPEFLKEFKSGRDYV